MSHDSLPPAAADEPLVIQVPLRTMGSGFFYGRQTLRLRSGATHTVHPPDWQPVGSMAPKRTIVPAYQCASGRHLVVADHGRDGDARHIASICCSPGRCTACGTLYDMATVPYDSGTKKKTRPTWCDVCRRQREAAAWQTAPRAHERDVNPSMIYADAWDRWFDELESYLDACINEGVDPAAGRPYLAEFQAARAPSLTEAINDEMYEDWDTPDWLAELQNRIEAEFAAHKPGAYHPSGTVPVLPTAAEWAREVAEHEAWEAASTAYHEHERTGSGPLVDDWLALWGPRLEERASRLGLDMRKLVNRWAIARTSEDLAGLADLTHTAQLAALGAYLDRMERHQVEAAEPAAAGAE